MGLYKQFATDSTLEKEGIWLDYNDFRILAARAGGANKKYLSYAEKKMKPFRRAISAGTVSVEQSRALMHDIYANTVILAWETKVDGKFVSGIEGPEGELLDFNVDNVIMTLENLPAIYDDVSSAVEGISLYRKEEMEADAKNS